MATCASSNADNLILIKVADAYSQWERAERGVALACINRNSALADYRTALKHALVESIMFHATCYARGLLTDKDLQDKVGDLIGHTINSLANIHNASQ